jgi:phosphoribosylanthranilate isomerase
MNLQHTHWPFRVKVCGVTRAADAAAAVVAGADAIGLNFFSRSPRYVEVQLAQSIAAELPPETARVGVFVNASAGEILRKSEQLNLSLAQLHGDEAADFPAQLPAWLRIIKAFRLRKGEGLAHVADYLNRAESAGRVPNAILIDAFSKDAYGGTGTAGDWAVLALERASCKGLPLILAGGLKPGNVGQAIRTARPDAVDVASGVESALGIKDRELVRQFTSRARAAFAGL